MTTEHRTREGEMLDEICWRHYGSSAGYVERVLEANYRLEEQPLVLPAGLIITLPEIVVEPIATTIRLWD